MSQQQPPPIPSQGRIFAAFVGLPVLSTVLYLAYLFIESRMTPVVRGDDLPRPVVNHDAVDEREARERLKALWAAYDAGPRDKARLAVTTGQARAAAQAAPAQVRGELARGVEAAARYRMAPLIRPETRADGDDGEVLIPSSNAAQCLVWGSMWANESAADLRTLGFTKIVCPADKREWPL